MRYEPLPPKFHAQNRQRLSEAIGQEAIAIIDTADVLSRPGDFEYPFRPDSNFYYLTGIDESEAILVLAPGHPNKRLREILFLRETNDFIALWAGRRLTQEEATARSGIQTVLWLEEYTSIMDHILPDFRTIYLNAESQLAPGPLSPSARRARLLKQKLPMHELRSCVRILGEARTVKAPVEIEQLRRAIDITAAGLQAAWSTLRPNLPEYALEAELTAEFTRRGATGSGFSAIVATGKNTTVIHSVTDATKIGKTDLVLTDVGAEAGYYAADISRTVPASGQFTPRQRAVYEAVYRTQQAAIALHKPGTSILEIDNEMRKQLLKEIVSLGLITAAQAKSSEGNRLLSKYYPHTSHHLGLDVHDTGDRATILKPGMVVTCEPGLYLPEEGIGVRLEDDILITETGYEVLSKAIPSAPDDIEAMIGDYQK